jgi:hypothetical protein
MSATAKEDAVNTRELLLRDSHAIRRVAVAAACDPRTVQRVLLGRPVLSMTRVRVERALRRLGLGDLVPRATERVLDRADESLGDTGRRLTNASR